MQPVENEPFVYADLLYDSETGQYGYALVVVQDDHSYDIGAARTGFHSLEEARTSAFQEHIHRQQTKLEPSLQHGKAWQLFLLWIAAAFAASLLSASLGATTHTLMLAGRAEGGLLAETLAIIDSFGMYALDGLILGVAQWLVLRQYFPRLAWKGWVLASGVGMFVSRFLMPLLAQLVFRLSNLPPGEYPSFRSSVIFIILVFAAVGVAQWIVLRRHVRRAAWWIPASAAAGAVTIALQYVLVRILRNDTLSPAESYTQSYLYSLVWSIIAAMGAAVTGLALIWISQRDADIASPESSSQQASSLEMTGNARI